MEDDDHARSTGSCRADARRRIAVRAAAERRRARRPHHRDATGAPLRGLTRSLRVGAPSSAGQRRADAIAARRARGVLRSTAGTSSLSTMDGLDGRVERRHARGGCRPQPPGTRYLGGPRRPRSSTAPGSPVGVRASGVHIPRVTSQQILAGTYVPRDPVAPGDLIFLDGGHHVDVPRQRAFVEALTPGTL